MRAGRSGHSARPGAGRAQPAPAARPPRDWPALGGIALIAVATLALGAYALLGHPVGDTATESDFYSGYAAGARALAHGKLDFSRYGVYGPVYEVLLALAGAVVRDLFTAARLLSVLAAGVTLAAWWAVAKRRLGSTAALALVAMLAINPTLVRYGYSASTDMTAVALFSLSAFATFGMRGPRAPALAGALAALATLTRYNLATLLPAGVLLFAIGAGRSRTERIRAVAWFTGGALLVLLPWTLASLASGHVPGAMLARDRGYYLGGDPSQTLENRYRDLGAGVGAPAAPGAPGAAATLLSRIARGGVEHLALDATRLAGLPAAALAVAGLLLALARRRLRAFAPFVPLAVLTFLPLAPIFYTERYSLVLLPLYLLPAAWLLAYVAGAPWPRTARLGAVWALSIAVLVPTAWWSYEYQAGVRADLPRVARATGEAIRARVVPGDRLLARKAHAAYYAGLEPVAFPLMGTLPSLAGYCRANRVHYLYYSSVEALSRPAFGFLLDTSAVVPGLSVLHATTNPPVVVYRIEPGFGALPAWWPDEATRRRISARVMVLLDPGFQARPLLLQLADDELRRDRVDEALRDALEADRLDPSHPDAKRLAAEALRRLGRPDAAIEALRQVLAIAPDDTATQLGLGLALRDTGRPQEAADAWRPLVGSTRDPELLRAMAELFATVGDEANARMARTRLGAREAGRRR